MTRKSHLKQPLLVGRPASRTGATLTAVARTMPVANAVPLKAVCALE